MPRELSKEQIRMFRSLSPNAQLDKIADDPNFLKYAKKSLQIRQLRFNWDEWNPYVDREVLKEYILVSSFDDIEPDGTTRSAAEVGLVLGLKNSPDTLNASIDNEGINIGSARQMMLRRYQETYPEKELPYFLLRDEDALELSREVSMFAHGDYRGFLTEWEGHAVSLHIIKDQEKTHFIYVNRGNRAIGDSDANVMVFTPPNEEVADFARAIFTAFQSGHKKDFKDFLERHQKQVNPQMRDVFAKKDQKVGNCSIANSNISVHFQLAAEYMKKHRVGFVEAYHATQKDYKAFRKQDRLSAYSFLLNNPQIYSDDKVFFYNFLQASQKFIKKDSLSSDQEASYQHLTSRLLTDLYAAPATTNQIDPHAITELLIGEDFEERMEEYIETCWAISGELSHQKEAFYIRQRNDVLNTKKALLAIAFPKLPKDEQIEKIKSDPSLINYAHPDLQREFLLNPPMTNYWEAFAQYKAQTPVVGSAELSVLIDVFKEWQANLELSPGLLGVKKTSGNCGYRFLLSTAEEKEAEINSKITAFNLSLTTLDDAKINAAFDVLCCACAKKRGPMLFGIGNPYSVDTASVKCLIEEINKRPTLRTYLGVHSESELKARVQAAFSQQACHGMKEQLKCMQSPAVGSPEIGSDPLNPHTKVR